MGFLNKLFGGIAKVLNVVAPIAMFIPGLQFLSIAAMVANVATGLTAKPPDWKGILCNLVTAAIPMGLGKALQAFGGGTAAQFAKLVGDKLTGTLSEVAKKVGNSTITNLVGKMNAQILSPAVQGRFAEIISRATNTKPGDHLTRELLEKNINNIAYGIRDTLDPIASSLGLPLNGANSTFSQPREPQIVIPKTIDGIPVYSDAPTLKVSRDVRG